MNHSVDRYLVSTEYCDCHNESLKRKAQEIVNDSVNKKESALKIFYWVRDEILFNSTLNIFKKASTTIEEGTVDYCSKINLHSAFLRAVGIPARMQYAQIDKEILRHFVPKFLFNRIPDPIGHAWCECYLDNEWISCEALFDESLYSGLIKENVISFNEIPSINWDGSNDLILLEKWIITRNEPISSFDDLVKYELKKVGYPPKIFCILFNWLAALGSRRTTNKFRDII
jgi:hypothetical protein